MNIPSRPTDRKPRMTAKEFNTSVDQYADNLFRFVVKHLRNEDAARDVVQETFAKVWQKHEEINAEKVKSYLFTTAHRTLIDLLRKEKYKQDETYIDQISHVEPVKNMDLQKTLDRALEQLPEIQKTVVLLRDYEGYSYDEIGEITGLEPSQVKVYIFRARKKLQKILVSVEAVLD